MTPNPNSLDPRHSNGHGSSAAAARRQKPNWEYQGGCVFEKPSWDYRGGYVFFKQLYSAA
jgi:hypothetical protein